MAFAGKVFGEHSDALALEQDHVGSGFRLDAALVNREQPARQHVEGQGLHGLRPALSIHTHGQEPFSERRATANVG